MPQDSTLSSKDAKKRKQNFKHKSCCIYFARGFPFIFAYVFARLIDIDKKAKHPIVLLMTHLTISGRCRHGGGARVWCLCCFYAVIKTEEDLSILTSNRKLLVWKGKEKVFERPSLTHTHTVPAGQFGAMLWVVLWNKPNSIPAPPEPWDLWEMSDRFVVSRGGKQKCVPSVRG